MGDGITTAFDVFAFFLIFVGIPTFIFGMPIVVLGFLSARRRVLLNRKHANELSEYMHQDSITEAADIPKGWPWLVALLLLAATMAIAYLTFATPVSNLIA